MTSWMNIPPRDHTKASSSDSVWKADCVHALLASASLPTPANALHRSIADGSLQLPSTQHKLLENSETGERFVEIWGIELHDATFSQNFLDLVKGLLLSWLKDDLDSSYGLTAGVVWTSIIHNVTKDLNAPLKREVLSLSREILAHSDSATPGVKPSTRSAFRYHPLPEEDASIRLLVLLPGEPTNDQIDCQLAYGQLDVGLEFDALSYVWGSPSQTRDIQVDEQTFSITSNLYDALKTLRHTDRPRVLWVDAICINQCDIEERASQVRLMGDLYSQAKTVLAWLGPESQTDQLALGFMEKLASMYASNASTTSDDQKELAIANGLDFFGKTCFHGDGRIFGAVLELLNTPYFQRAWIVQELAMAGQIVFHRGVKTFTFIQLHLFLESYHTVYAFGTTDSVDSAFNAVNLRRTRLNRKRIGQAIDRATEPKWHSNWPEHGLSRFLSQMTLVFDVWSICNQVRTGSNGTHFTLRLLDMARSRGCTDPRDRVFSIIHIDRRSNVDGLMLIQPDYSMSAEEVYVKVARNIMERENNLQLLTRAPPANDQPIQRSRMLPSWVPDWGAEPERPSQNVRRVEIMTQFKPCGPSLSSLELRFRADGRLLQARGIIVDTVQQPVDLNRSSTDSLIRSFHKCCRDFGIESNTLTKKRASFWRTLLLYLAADKFFQLTSPSGAQDSFSPPSASQQPGEVSLGDEFRFPPQTLQEEIEMLKVLWCYEQFAAGVCMSHGIYVTARQSCILAPLTAHAGDEVVVFPNTRNVFLLRKAENFHLLIGTCYQDDIMNGEVLKEPLASQLSFETILIA